jgi:ribonuclease HI
MIGKIKIFIDGACRGNPGDAATGIIFCDSTGKVIKQMGFYLGWATNNIAEYMGLIKALEKSMEFGFKEIEVFSDSQLLTKQIRGEYAVRNQKLKELFKKAQELINRFSYFSLDHIPRKENILADRMANEVLDSAHP